MIALYPKHLSYFLKNSELFTKLKPQYPPSERVLPDYLPKISPLKKNEKISGPIQSLLLGKIVNYFIFLVVLFLPLFIMPILYIQNLKFEKSSNHVISSYFIHADTVQLIVSMFTFVYFPSNTTFWDYGKAVPDFKQRILSAVTRLQEGILHYTGGFEDDNISIDPSLSDQTLEILSTNVYFPLLKLNFSYYQTLMSSTFVVDDMIVNDHMLNSSSDIKSYEGIIKDVQEVAEKILLDVRYDISQMDPFGKPLITIDPFILMGIMVFLILIFLIYILTTLKTAVKSQEFFYKTLRGVSKAEINQAIGIYTKLQKLITNSKSNSTQSYAIKSQSKGGHFKVRRNNFHPLSVESSALINQISPTQNQPILNEIREKIQVKKNNKVNSQKTSSMSGFHRIGIVREFVFPLTLIFVFIFIFIVLFHLYSNCNVKQIKLKQNMLDYYEEISSNLSIIAMRYLELVFGFKDGENVTELRIIIDRRIKEFRIAISDITPPSSGYCHLCTKQELLLTNSSFGQPYFRIFVDWISRVQQSINLPVDTEAYKDLPNTVSSTFFFFIQPQLQLFGLFIQSQINNQTRVTKSIEISLICLYSIFLLMLCFVLPWGISRSDKPFKILIQSLKRLPDGVLSKETEKILREKKWNFQITQLNYDLTYYSYVLEILPDPVLVIDRGGHILSSNLSAAEILNHRGKKTILKPKIVNNISLYSTAANSANSMANANSKNPENSILASDLNGANANSNENENPEGNEEELNTNENALRMSRARVTLNPRPSQGNLIDNNLSESSSTTESTNSVHEAPTIDNSIKMKFMIFNEEKEDNRTLQDILVADYLLTDRSQVKNFKLVGTKNQHKYFFQLTILPIFEERDSIFVQQNQTKADNVALIFRDIGDEIRQQKLVKEETEKHLAIIKQVLPSKIADLLLENSHSISITVEKVAIAFCDIVSFTPWCGSNDADTVVDTLNLMFKIFDESISKYEHLTKIKCIGDCYMSAAGIFSGKTPPDIFLTQMVYFGLDMLSGIDEVNKVKGTHLQVRVGIGFGGPISAGVMGIHKPAFDVWGEIVNDSNAMESSGAPMKVHIGNESYEIVKSHPLVFEPKGDGTWFVTRPKIADL